MKKTLRAASLALALSAVATQASADYITTLNFTGGQIDITGHGDGNPLTYTMTLYDLNGSLNIQTPANGSHYTVYAKGTMGLDIVPTLPGDDLTITYTDWTPIYTGAFAQSGLTLPSYSFNFLPGAPGPGTVAPIPVLSFALAYSGALSNLTAPYLSGPLAAPLITVLSGLPSPISGNTSVTGNVLHHGGVPEGLQFNVTESGLNWMGFGGLLYALETSGAFGSGNNVNAMTGSFSSNLSLRFVPEPATLGLLGLGLLGLAAARRRAV